MPAGASPEPLPSLPITVPMWEHDAFGRVGGMASPFGLPASAFYSQGSLQVLRAVGCVPFAEGICYILRSATVNMVLLGT